MFHRWPSKTSLRSWPSITFDTLTCLTASRGGPARPPMAFGTGLSDGRDSRLFPLAILAGDSDLFLRLQASFGTGAEPFYLKRRGRMGLESAMLFFLAPAET